MAGELHARLGASGGARHLVDGSAPIFGYIVGNQIAGTTTGIAAAIGIGALVAAV